MPRGGWVYEEGIDGSQVLAWKRRDEVRLLIRDSKDFTGRSPPAMAAVGNLAGDLVLD